MELDVPARFSSSSSSQSSARSPSPTAPYASQALPSQAYARQVLRDIDNLLQTRRPSVQSASLSTPPRAPAQPQPHLQPQRAPAVQGDDAPTHSPAGARGEDWRAAPVRASAAVAGPPADPALTAALESGRQQREHADAHAHALKADVQARLTALRHKSDSLSARAPAGGGAGSSSTALVVAVQAPPAAVAAPVIVAGEASVHAPGGRARRSSHDRGEYAHLAAELAREAAARAEAQAEVTTLRAQLVELQREVALEARDRVSVFSKRDDILRDSHARLQGQVQELGRRLAAAEAEAATSTSVAEDRLARVQALSARVQSARLDSDLAVAEAGRLRAALDLSQATAVRAAADAAGARQEVSGRDHRLALLSKEVLRLKQFEPVFRDSNGALASHVQQLEHAVAESEGRAGMAEEEARRLASVNRDLLATLAQADETVARLTSALTHAEAREGATAHELAELHAAGSVSAAEAAARVQAAEADVRALRARAHGALTEAGEAQAQASAVLQRVSGSESRASAAEALSDALRSELLKRDALVAALQAHVSALAHEVHALRVQRRPSVSSPTADTHTLEQEGAPVVVDTPSLAAPPSLPSASPMSPLSAETDFRALLYSHVQGERTVQHDTGPGEGGPATSPPLEPSGSAVALPRDGGAHAPPTYTYDPSRSAFAVLRAVERGEEELAPTMRMGGESPPLSTFAPKLRRPASPPPALRSTAAHPRATGGAQAGAFPSPPPLSRTTAPVRAANHKRVCAALSSVLLAGKGDADRLAAAKRVVEGHAAYQVVIALVTSGSKSAGQFAGLYAVHDDAAGVSDGRFGTAVVGGGGAGGTGTLGQGGGGGGGGALATRIFGPGPDALSPSLVQVLFKYDTASRGFSPIGQSATFTVTTDAVGIDPSNVIVVRKEDGSSAFVAKDAFF